MGQNDQHPFAHRETRRAFIKKTAATTAVVAGASGFGSSLFAQNPGSGIGIVVDPEDAVAKQAPAQWAVEQCRAAFKARGVATEVYETLAQVPVGHDCLLVCDSNSVLASGILNGAGTAVPNVPEALGLVHREINGRSVLLACGSEVRGLMYALLELVDCVNCGLHPVAAISGKDTIVERPANVIRSIARLFTSDVEDKGWFNDRQFWQEYLTMLATQRFNRFSLMLGIGYDFTTEIRDCYFHFAYPFLLSVPGYDVRAVGLPDSERDANLVMLRFISEEAARRGLHFQLGLWTHAYKWTKSPQANYTIAGLTPETQGPYCRDALQALLVACPAIQGVTLRIHGESGVAEGSYDFWRNVFEGVTKCGRRVELDLHAKGMDQPTLDGALATGLPVNISPKYWAEHLGLPYMQAGIRPLEVPAPDSKDNGFFAKSSGSRKFLRYGYGDLLAEDRRYGVFHRIWPGTQRLLLWGDPLTAAAYGKDFSFCDTLGMEWCEPLSFKGRKGSGLPGGRDAYADESLRTPGGGWEKYLYTYRLWGRLAYNPAAKAEIWQRCLHQQFGAGADAIEASLASASRILPLITTAHCPSAANNNYWPEIYSNMPVADETKPGSYGDTLAPKRFGTVSPLDPQLFSRMDDFAEELLSGQSSGKYSPVEVAQWLEELAGTARKRLAEAEKKASAPQAPEFRRLAVDVAIQSGLGVFFAHKFRAGVLYALFDRSGFRPAMQEAVQSYRAARAAWAELAGYARGVYTGDITFGYDKQLRGCWQERLAAIDEDIADLEKRLAAANDAAGIIEPQRVEAAIKVVRARARRGEGGIEHRPQKTFQRGEKILVEAAAKENEQRAASARLYYRRVNQAEQWRSVEMMVQEKDFSAEIPAGYTDSPFPIQYYFELRNGSLNAWLYPGLDINRPNQPYFVVRQGKAA